MMWSVAFFVIGYYRPSPINYMKARRSWTEKEDQTFRRIVGQHRSLNWAQIAKKLSNDHGFKKRTGKQCRQRWFNHLVPGISKKIWTKAEEQNLLNLQKRFGNKWTIISQHLTGRTDNSIKNYFYSTIRRSLRRMGKIIGSKNSTSLLREIKPSILTRIFSPINDQEILNFQEFVQECKKSQLFQKIREEIIQFSTFKPKIKHEITQEQRQRYKNVFDLILKFNDIYKNMKEKDKDKKSKEQMLKKDYKLMMNQESQDNHDEIQSFDLEESESDKQDNQEEQGKNLVTRTRQIKRPEKLLFESCVDSKKIRKERQSRMKMTRDIQQQQPIELILFQNQPEGKLQCKGVQEYNIDPVFEIDLSGEVQYQYSKYVNSHMNLSPSARDGINLFKSPMCFKRGFSSIFEAEMKVQQFKPEEIVCEIKQKQDEQQI